MDERKLDNVLKQVRLLLQSVTLAVSILVLLTVLIATGALDDLIKKNSTSGADTPKPAVIDGIHVATGLIDAPELQLVITNCTGCHSSKLITQNRMSLTGWSSTIKWMQETQNLWDLGENEEAILTYLATNYAPTKKGRRANLGDIEWYELD